MNATEHEKVSKAREALQTSTWWEDRETCAAALDELLAQPVEPEGWQPMKTAPKDGTAVLVLLDGSDIPHAVRWINGPESPHYVKKLMDVPGWHITWDASPLSILSGPRYWMHCPDDPDDASPQPPKQGDAA